MDTSSELVARLALSTAFEPGDETIGQLVAEHTALGTVSRLGTPAALTRYSHLVRRWAVRDWLAEATREREQTNANGVALLWPGHSGWPTQLNDLQDRAPLVLRVKGPLDLRQAASRSVAVVGARAATQYGIWVAEELCAELAAAGWCVISGGAMGIDAASHRGALAVGGTTVAVSAAGADLAVPATNHSLFARLFAEGAVVSEVPLGARPNRRRFLVRNRVIAALCPLVVVVEAALRSGALSTAREGDAMGRILCAVPGPTTSSLSAGCNELIRNGGAALVRNADDVIGEVLERAPGAGVSSGDSSPVNLYEQHILDVCAPRSVTTDVVAAHIGVSVESAHATLHLLERRGLVMRTVKGWRTRERIQASR